jgi:hypothetical protein
MLMQQEQEGIERLEADWKAKQEKWQELHNQYFSSGSSLPVQWPPRVTTPEALEAIEAAKRAEEKAYQRYLNALVAHRNST